MDPASLSKWIELVPQLALVIVFIYFSLEMQRIHSRSDEQKRQDFIAALDRERTDYLASLNEISCSQSEMAQQQAVTASNLGQLTIKVDSLERRLAAHDDRTRPVERERER